MDLSTFDVELIYTHSEIQIIAGSSSGSSRFVISVFGQNAYSLQQSEENQLFSPRAGVVASTFEISNKILGFYPCTVLAIVTFWVCKLLTSIY